MTQPIIKAPIENFPFFPKGRGIIVIPEEENETSSGGIVIPEMHRTKLNQGHVFRIGPEVSTVKLGENIIWSMHMEQRVGWDRHTIFFLQEEDVLAGDKIVDPNQPELPLESSKPVIVPNTMTAHEANQKYGERFGVDWIYESGAR